MGDKDETENGAQEAQRLQREATKSRAGGPFGPVVDKEDGPEPGTEGV